MKVYFFPPIRSLSKTQNPYKEDFMSSLNAYCNVINHEYIEKKSSVLSLLKNVFKADIYIINWPDNIPFSRAGTLQTYVFLFLLRIIKFRKAKIIWVFHNFHAHSGENKLTAIINKCMYKYTDEVITHSQDAYIYLKEERNIKAYYFDHPIKTDFFDDNKENDNLKVIYDVLIWGSINPYKGIVPFLEYIDKNNYSQHFSIKIIGKCDNKEYANKIVALSNEKISFENRAASFNELKEIVANSKFTLFPYVGTSVSSSGALIDTIAWGGNPIGPNIGAFKDLNKQGVCLTYSNYEEMINILLSNSTIKNEYREKFISDNSWESFAFNLYKIISR